MKERDEVKKTRPSDKTISQNANLIHDFYSWLKLKNFPIAMDVNTRGWKFKYKDEGRLTYTRSQLSETRVDHSSISVVGHRRQVSNRKAIIIMPLHDQLRLMSAYKDTRVPFGVEVDRLLLGLSSSAF